MGRMIQIRVDESLKDILERIRREVAEDMKKKYGLKTITVHGTLASQIACAKLMGKREFNFKIEKNGLNSGVLKLI